MRVRASQTSVWRILHAKELHVPHVQRVMSLTASDYQNRLG